MWSVLHGNPTIMNAFVSKNVQNYTKHEPQAPETVHEAVNT